MFNLAWTNRLAAALSTVDLEDVVLELERGFGFSVTPSWRAEVSAVEAAGEALADEALRRCDGDALAAAIWITRAWRPQPDNRECGIKSEALGVLRRLAGVAGQLEAQRLAGVA